MFEFNSKTLHARVTDPVCLCSGDGAQAENTVPAGADQEADVGPRSPAAAEPEAHAAPPAAVPQPEDEDQSE